MAIFKTKSVFICIIFLLFLGLSSKTMAQSTIKILVKSFPDRAAPAKIFIAGNFNQWQPAQTALSFDSLKQQWFVQLENLKQNKISYKFTLGSWQTVETNLEGTDIANREIFWQKDTIVVDTILAWKTTPTKNNENHSLSKNVRIIDSIFSWNGTIRKTRLWVYLPKNYTTSYKRYPVIYMQDGQNIFDQHAASFMEWGVDEMLDSLIAIGKPAAIIVGINNTPDRLTEYQPFENKNFEPGGGDAYVDFVADVLKPFIDRRFRTWPQKNNTLIAGSSMGGLIAYYAWLKRRDVFGKAGIFSPSFWAAPGIKNFTDSIAPQISGKIFFYAGEQESAEMVADVNEIMNILGLKSSATIYNITDTEGRHNETAWAHSFAAFYLWALAPGNNIILPIEN